MYFPLQPISIVKCNEFFVISFIIFVLSKYRTELLVTNHVILRERNIFDSEEKSRKFLLEIKTLVSSANNIGSDAEFILRGRSYIYIYIYVYIYI
jgi:hypothetical protein